MKIKSYIFILALALASVVSAQIFPPIFDPKPSPSASSTTTADRATTTAPPPQPSNNSTSTQASTSAQTSSAATTAKPRTSSIASTTLPTSATTSATPTNTPAPEKSGDNTGLATAGIVVGSVIVAAAIGIWVFRKWKLSPSRDFQSKIRGDDYNDYPRTYESDSMHLRPMDQPGEPAPIKSSYNAQTAFPSPIDEQYYDPNYASKDQSGYNQGNYGHQDYGRGGATPGYDQGYDNYNEHGYGHGDYAQSQAGGYGHGDYAPSQAGGYNQGGYGQQSVGGGGYNQHNQHGTQLIIGGLLTYATGVSAALTFLPSSSSSTSDPDNPDRFPTESTRRSTFDTLAPGYDKEVGMHEYLLGIQRRRKRLLKQAKGRVLEIASGTGRNVDYYTKGCCNEIIFSDFSEGMMQVLKQNVAKSDLGKRYDYQLRRQQQLELERIAHSKSQQQQAPAVAIEKQDVVTAAMPSAQNVVETEIRFKSMNAAAIPYPDQSFDTVVDTFGLCSFEDPVQVLKEMKRVLRPGGKLLLLEHGNSHWGFMQDMQAKQLDRHVHKYGCYWNREIEQLVEEAGLKVVEKERAQLGTVYYIVATSS
ncbi:Methyltransferase-like protein 7B [Mortierella sp. AM989]|nr:Methyltransferase-like protein 7B [Mortierella sp. AM989]